MRCICRALGLSFEDWPVGSVVQLHTDRCMCICIYIYLFIYIYIYTHTYIYICIYGKGVGNQYQIP